MNLEVIVSAVVLVGVFVTAYLFTLVSIDKLEDQVSRDEAHRMANVFAVLFILAAILLGLVIYWEVVR
jgi:hypothetical protein